MATTNALKEVSLPQGEDLRTRYAELLKLNTAGQVVRADAAGDLPVGVLMSEPDTAEVGEPVAVGLIGGGGIGKVKTSAAIALDRILVPTATAGRAGSVANIAGLAGNQVGFGQPLQAAGAAGEIIEFLAGYVAKSA